MDLDYILQHAAKSPVVHRHNAAKDALQQCLLAALGRQGLLAGVALIGGTALRILHQLPRYSEDLDFIWGNPQDIGPTAEWETTIRRAVQKIGLNPHISAKGPQKVDARVEKRSFTIYVAATHPSIVPFARDGLQISFELDLDPPQGTLREFRTLTIAGEQVTVPTLTLPSLMCGKLHILLTRSDREKGRDWYDYLWYRRAGILPNIPQLQNAIDQTSTGPDARYWASYLRERTKHVDWENIRHDVAPFLLNQEEVKDLNEITIANITPYPDFAEIAHELERLGLTHPLLTSPNPVVADIEQAAMEGEIDAIDAQRVIDRLRSAG